MPSLQLLCISGVVVSQRASFGSHFEDCFGVNVVFAAITATCLAVIDQSNSCTLIGRFGLIAIVSYDFVLRAL